jgi:hypothetical protein
MRRTAVAAGFRCALLAALSRCRARSMCRRDGGEPRPRRGDGPQAARSRGRSSQPQSYSRNPIDAACRATPSQCRATPSHAEPVQSVCKCGGRWLFSVNSSRFGHCRTRRITRTRGSSCASSRRSTGRCVTMRSKPFHERLVPTRQYPQCSLGTVWP